MCSIELEPCEVWEESEVRARKEHVCDACGVTILKGARYVRHFSVYDKEPTHEKCCAACEEIRERFRGEHDTIGVPSWLAEGLHECIDGLLYHPETAEWVLDLFAMAARGHVNPPYEKEGSLLERKRRYESRLAHYRLKASVPQ